MKKITTLGVVGFSSLALNLYGEERPNIIFFLVDDMGWQETSVPFHTEKTKLNYIYNTPNMERLAAEAVRFTQAYACPLSSPTRISLMTGQNEARHKVTNWTLFKGVSPDHYYKSEEVEVPKWNVNGMSMGERVEDALYVTVTLPSILQKAGYQTIHIGKAHWGAISTSGEDPLNLGFDINIAGHAAGGPGSYYGTNNFSAAFRNGGAEWDIPGLEKYHGEDINLTEVLTLEASTLLERAAETKQPFYMYMSHYAIHAPWEPDTRFLEKYKNMGLSDFQANYASMIESMDKSLGDIMQQLKRLGLYDNTIIIFMSDNGQPSQTERNRPLRGHKITPYEGGIRVPLMVKMVNNDKMANTICDVPVVIEDIYPTILEMASADEFINVTETIDGVSIMPQIKKSSKKGADRALFWHYPHIYDVQPYSVIRKGNWKLIWHYATQKAELFNLKDDIGERNDLVNQEVKVAQELRKELREFLVKVDASIPISKVNQKPFDLP